MVTAVLICAAIVVTVLDQGTKLVVVARLPEGRGRQVGGWELRRVHNRAGGLVPMSMPAVATLWCAVVAGLVLAFALGEARPGAASAVGLALAVGGATGNLVDRIVRGEVVDFVVVRRWPVFNLADVALVVGLVLTPWTLL